MISRQWAGKLLHYFVIRLSNSTLILARYKYVGMTYEFKLALMQPRILFILFILKQLQTTTYVGTCSWKKTQLVMVYKKC